MKSYELKPTYENLLRTFQDDTIGRNADIFRFIDILNAMEEGSSIALDGNWGSGKTFFVKQVKMVLDAHNLFIPAEKEERGVFVEARNRFYKNNAPELQPLVCVYYDAWENDNDDDPVLSLVYTILNDVDTDFKLKNIDAIKAGASVMEFFSGRNWTQMIESLRGESPLDALKGRKGVEGLIGEFLESLLPEKGNRLVVFVDELDRCKPSYAVKLLERVKHYFCHENITFVFSVNTNELQHVIRKHYGNSFDGSRYLDRFFDLRVALPPPDLSEYYRSREFNDRRYVFDITCNTVIRAYHFELREIAKYLRLVRMAAHKPTHSGQSGYFSPDRAVLFCLYYVLPIVIGLRVHDAKRYTDFVEGRDYSPLYEIAKKTELLDFRELLNCNETYDSGKQDKTQVTLEEKMKEVYNAIFNTTYNGINYHTKIGALEFNDETKPTLMRATGLLSHFTTLDID